MFKLRRMFSLLVLAVLSFGTFGIAFASSVWPASDLTVLTYAGNNGLPSGFEPSGMVWTEDGLAVVGDDGDLYLLDADGNVLNSFWIGGDLEGITTKDPASQTVYIAVENPDSVLGFDLSTGQLTGEYWDLTPWLISADNLGMEALTYVDGYFYAGLQEDGDIYIFDLQDNGSVTFIEKKDMYYPSDISGMYYDSSTGLLYSLYDSNDRIVITDRNWNIVDRLQVPGFNQEGISLGLYPSTDIYFAEDSGRVTMASGFPSNQPQPEPEPEVISGPNLYVTNLAINPLTQKVTYTIGNDGDTSVTDYTEGVNTIYVDGVEWQDRYWKWHSYYSSLYGSVGGTVGRAWFLYRNQIMSDFETGDVHTLTVCTDADGVLAELDESDNCQSIDWEFQAVLPDMYVEFGSFEDFTLTYTLGNQGILDTFPFNGQNAVFLNGRRVEFTKWNAESSKTYLKVGNSETRTYSVDQSTLKTGKTYTVKVCVDRNGVIAELDESNNCMEYLFVKN